MSNATTMLGKEEFIRAFPFYALTSYTKEDVDERNTLLKWLTSPKSPVLEVLRLTITTLLKELNISVESLEFTGISTLTTPFARRPGSRYRVLPGLCDGARGIIEIANAEQELGVETIQLLENNAPLPVDEGYFMRNFALVRSHSIGLSVEISHNISTKKLSLFLHTTKQWIEDYCHLSPNETIESNYSIEQLGNLSVLFGARIPIDLSSELSLQQMGYEISHWLDIGDIIILGERENSKGNYRFCGELTLITPWSNHLTPPLSPIEICFDCNEKKWLIGKASATEVPKEKELEMISEQKNQEQEELSENHLSIDNKIPITPKDNFAEQLSTRLDVIIATKEMPLSELIETKEKMIIHFDKEVASEVEIRLGNERYAYGELVEVAGHLGVRLTKIIKKFV